MAETKAEQHLRATGGGRRPWRGAVLAALALLLVAFVGLGSRAPLWDIGGPPRLADPESYTGDLVVVGFALLVMLPVVITAFRRRSRATSRDPDLPPARVPWWVRVLSLLAIPAAVLVALLLLKTLPGAGPDIARKIKPRPGLAPPSPRPDLADHGPPIHWWGYTLLALIVVGGLVTALKMREVREERAATPEEPDELLAAVDLSLEDLESEPDPRRAVIRAYARMERALGSYGLARRPSETPLEYLSRALASLRVGRRSVERLSALFERAKFSDHEIDLSMKTEAVAALGALRDELAGVAA